MLLIKSHILEVLLHKSLLVLNVLFYVLHCLLKIHTVPLPIFLKYDIEIKVVSWLLDKKFD